MERKNSGLKRKREATPEASASPVREGAWTTFYNLKIYCSALAFNPYHSDIFVAVGLNLAAIYRLKTDDWESIQEYLDEDMKEEYLTCCWSYDSQKLSPLLAVAGKHGVIRVFDCSQTSTRFSLRGHLRAVNDLKFHPSQPHLLLSASSDESLRLWDLTTGKCTLVFHSESYAAPIYSCDFHPNGEQFVCSGGKNAVLVWALIDKHSAENKQSAVRSRKPEIRKFAEYVAVHAKEKCQDKWVVDGVAWYGDMLVMRTIAHKKLWFTYGTLVDINDKRKQLLGLPLEEQYDKEDPSLDFRLLESLSFTDNAISPKSIDLALFQRFHIHDTSLHTDVLVGKLVEWSLTTFKWSEMDVKGSVLDSALSPDKSVLLVASSDGLLRGYKKYS